MCRDADTLTDATDTGSLAPEGAEPTRGGRTGSDGARARLRKRRWRPTLVTLLAAALGAVLLGTPPAHAVAAGGWTPRNSGTTGTVSAVACPSATTCYATAGLGTVLSTTDGGATWISHTVSGAPALNAIACPGVSTCYAVGWDGAIVRTTDSGATWTP